MEYAVVASRLTKKFKDVAAVNDLSFGVKRGGIFGLVGPDGAGKTTALQLISTALFPDSGTVSIEGFDSVKQTDSVRLRVGYMPQSMSLYGDLTVEEQLDFHADLYSVDRSTREEKKKRLYDFSKLAPFRDRPADKLSGGMKKKLALACTLIHTPKVLILDEPTTGVDPLSRRELWNILSSLVPDVTIIMSTPYMDEAEKCDMVGLMYGGGLKAIDTPKNLLSGFAGRIIEVRCSDLIPAHELLSKMPGIRGAQVFGDSLHVFVDAHDEKAGEIENKLKAGGYDVKGIREIRPRLEDVFVSLMKA